MVFSKGVVVWVVFSLGLGIWVVFSKGVVVWVVFSKGVVVWVVFSRGLVVWLGSRMLVVWTRSMRRGSPWRWSPWVGVTWDIKELMRTSIGEVITCWSQTSDTPELRLR